MTPTNNLIHCLYFRCDSDMKRMQVNSKKEMDKVIKDIKEQMKNWNKQQKEEFEKLLKKQVHCMIY